MQNGRSRPWGFPDLLNNESWGCRERQPHRTVKTARTSMQSILSCPSLPFPNLLLFQLFVSRTSAWLALFLRLETVLCRWSKALLCPRLQRRLQHQSLAQSMLLYATESCCTVVPKHKTLNLRLWKDSDNSCDPVVQGHVEAQGPASVKCNSLIFITDLLIMKYLAP